MKNKCEKTTSGKHKWVEYFDGIDEKATAKFRESLREKGYSDSLSWVPKYATKCQACGMYKF